MKRFVLSGNHGMYWVTIQCDPMHDQGSATDAEEDRIQKKFLEAMCEDLTPSELAHQMKKLLEFNG